MFSSAGYGVFIYHPEPTDLEIGSERENVISKRPACPSQTVAWSRVGATGPRSEALVAMNYKTAISVLHGPIGPIGGIRFYTVTRFVSIGEAM